MNYGLYLSASGLLTNSYRQDVFANNLANVNTVAFKPDMAAVQARPSASVEDKLGMDVSRKMLDRLGGGVQAAPQRIAFAPGPMQKTGGPLDVYIENDRAFFTINAADDQGQPATRFTRDGRFEVSNTGQLVTPKGYAVLDAGGSAITVPPNTKINIEANGDVIAGNAVVGRLAVSRIADLTALEKSGGNLFALKKKTSVKVLDQATLRPGTLEGSAADPISTLMQLIAATKAATGNANMIRYHDTLMDRAINTLGRVA